MVSVLMIQSMLFNCEKSEKQVLASKSGVAVNGQFVCHISSPFR